MQLEKSEEVEIVKSVPFQYGVVELRSDNILTYEPAPGVNSYQMPHVEELVSILMEVADGRRLPYYTNNTNFTQKPTSEVKTYTMNHLKDFASHCAMTERSPVTRFFVHAFMFVYKQEVEIKMFKEKEAAIAWLRRVGS